MDGVLGRKRLANGELVADKGIKDAKAAAYLSDKYANCWRAWRADDGNAWHWFVA